MTLFMNFSKILHNYLLRNSLDFINDLTELIKLYRWQHTHGFCHHHHHNIGHLQGH